MSDEKVSRAGVDWEKQPVREPAAAGTFYPADHGVLSGMLDKLLSSASAATALPGRIRALISPHAGYHYSGLAAATTFKLLEGASGIKRVIVLAPSHFVRLRGASVGPFKAFRTPFGDVPVDEESVRELLKCPLITQAPEPHEQEHSLEVELPFLQKTLGEFTLVPLVVGHLEVADYATLAAALLPLWDASTLVVVSSDFCHYGESYGFAPYGKADRNAIMELDSVGIDRIMSVDSEGFHQYLELSQNTICGRVPITLLLLMAQQRTIAPQPVLTSYYLSGDATGSYDPSVSYAGLVFCETDKPWRFEPSLARPLNTEEQAQLLKLARQLITDVVSGTNDLQMDSNGITPNMMRPGAAFVTLTKNGELRGCIGSFVTVEALIMSLAHNAVKAATQDPRFPAVQQKELQNIRIEINVLAPPKKLAGIDQFVAGKHGLILEKDGRRGLFLPEVMVEQRWTPEETLTQLCRKAGLKEDAWRTGYTLYGFETQIFRES